jgi:hypothetical protein
VNFGEVGYRSPYLSHAKRALYHLSYIPFLDEVHPEPLPGRDEIFLHPNVIILEEKHNS